LVRQGLVPFVKMLDSETHVVEASDLDEALPAAQGDGGGFDLVLLDLKMPGMRGVQGLKAMRQAVPEATPVVILSGSVEAADVIAAADNGAAGYLPKTLNSTAMINALRLVLSGERYFPSFAFAPRPEPASDYAEDNPLSPLEDRERVILGMVVDGRTNKEIARALALQEVTIKVQTRNIYRKLGAANRSQAVRIAMENGWRSEASA